MLALIAMALGVILIIWAMRNEGKGIRYAKVFGWLIIILAIGGTLCSSYYLITYWQKGYLLSPISINILQNTPEMNIKNNE